MKSHRARFFILFLVVALSSCQPQPTSGITTSRTEPTQTTVDGRWLAFDLRGEGVAEIRVDQDKMDIEVWDLPDNRSVTGLPSSLNLELEQSTAVSRLYLGHWPQEGSRFNLMLHSQGEAELLLPSGQLWLLRKTRKKLPEPLLGRWVVFSKGEQIGEMEMANDRWTYTSPGRDPILAEVIPLEGKSGYAMAQKLIDSNRKSTPTRLVHYNPLTEDGFLVVTELRWEIVTLYRPESF